LALYFSLSCHAIVALPRLNSKQCITSFTTSELSRLFSRHNYIIHTRSAHRSLPHSKSAGPDCSTHEHCCIHCCDLSLRKNNKQIA
jgi:hypothetical protein